MYVYHYDDFMAGFGILYVRVWFKTNVVLKLVHGQRVSNISVNLNFSKTFPTLIFPWSDISFV